MNYAVIDENGRVVNVILWDGVAPYNPGAGLVLVPSQEAARGDIYAQGVFTRPQPPGEGA